MTFRASVGREGYAILPGLTGGADVERYRDSIGLLRATRADGSCDRPNNSLVPLRWNDPPVMSVLRDEPRLRRVRLAAGGADLRWTSGYFSIKDPFCGPLWWHQDWWCWDHPVTLCQRAAQVALLCYLDDTTVSTGALRVLPGSHLGGLGLPDNAERAAAAVLDGLLPSYSGEQRDLTLSRDAPAAFSHRRARPGHPLGRASDRSR
jgi:hypothetical protein